LIADPAFSRLGFGVTGPHSGWGASRRHTGAMIRRAVELGVTVFDTGPAYGNGEAERRLGAALSVLPRERIFVVTKAGVHAGGRRDFSPGAVEMSFKASLDRLRTDRIDLLLLHGPSPEELDDRLIHRLLAFKERGLLRHIGVCGRGPELDRAIGLGAFDAVMAPVHAGLDATALARLTRARETGHAVLGIEVMAGHARPARLPRSRSELWYWARGIKQQLAGAKPAGSDVSAQDGLKWALEKGLADTLVCLTTNPAHLAGNARLAGLEGLAEAH
jgi:aryl-alcohol dehydrogenase-like predicted oxidoreductase